MAVFIDDGYTLEKTFEPTQRHPRVWIKFRPMLPAERTRLVRRGAAANALMTAARTDADWKAADAASEAMTKAVADSLAKHIVEWDVQNGEGTAEINGTGISRLPPALFEKLYNEVAQFGDGPADDSAKN